MSSAYQRVESKALELDPKDRANLIQVLEGSLKTPFSKEQDTAIRELCSGMKELMDSGKLKFADGDDADAELEAAIQDAS